MLKEKRKRDHIERLARSLQREEGDESDSNNASGAESSDREEIKEFESGVGDRLEDRKRRKIDEETIRVTDVEFIIKQETNMQDYLKQLIFSP